LPRAISFLTVQCSLDEGLSHHTQAAHDFSIAFLACIQVKSHATGLHPPRLRPLGRGAKSANHVKVTQVGIWEIPRADGSQTAYIPQTLEDLPIYLPGALRIPTGLREIATQNVCSFFQIRLGRVLGLARKCYDNLWTAYGEDELVELNTQRIHASTTEMLRNRSLCHDS